jgi:hypothetical protein
MKKKKKELPSNTPVALFVLTSVIYTPITIFLNILCYFLLHKQLLVAWANLLIFCVVAIGSAIALYGSHLYCKIKFVNRTATIYTIISFTVNAFVFIILDGSLWKLSTILLIFGYAALTSLLMEFLKIKSYLLRTLIYFVISLVFFLIMTILIANYTEGNTEMLLFLFFTIFYFFCSVIYYNIKRSAESLDNEEKTYKKQFD